MKKVTKLFMYFAVAAMTFVSCGKEEIKPVEPETPGVIKVRFGAESTITKALTPAADDLTFTADWIDGDEIGITSFSNGSSIESNLEAAWIEDAFYADFDAEKYATEHEYQFKGVFPYSASGTVDFGCVREQTLGSQNGKYDIMVSSTINSALPATKSLVLPMARQTATVYFHLKSELDEVVKSATLITEDGKWIAASTATLNHNGFSAPGDEYQIKLNILEDGDNNKMSTKDMQFWFNVLPVSETSLTLLVETETHSFTMSKKSKNTNWEAGHLYTTVIKDIPAEKWAEIERPAGVKTETITLSEFDNSANDFSVVTFKTSDEIVSASFNKGTASNKPAWVSEQLRLYPGSNLTIVASNNQTIKSITYNAVINAKKNGPTIRIDETSINDGDPLEWAGDKQSVVLSVGGSAGNIGFTSIDVTYTDPNGSTDPIYKYSVMVDKNVTNGTITVDNTSAKEGDEVTITATPSDGYELVAGSVKAYNAVSGAELTVTNNKKFTMPAANVNVTAAFSLIPTLSAISPEPYASNLTNNNGAGFSIPVTANQAWVAAIKADDPNAAEITLMTAEGEGGENNNLVFKFNSQNTSPLAAKSTVVVLSPKNGNRPEPVEITITHEKRGATLVLNDDDRANITANVLATETSYIVNITNANFSEWSVLEYKIGDAAQSTSDANCVTTHDDGANTGSVTIGFPANASESNDVTITLKIGYEGIITKTLTLTQAAAAARTPNVTLDFTDNTSWGFPTSKVEGANTYNDGTTTITLKGTTGNGYSFNERDQYLLLGKSGATLTFQSFDFDVDRIKIYGKAGASASVVQNIFVGETAVSTATTGATDTYTYDINSDYQAAGNVYLLKVTSSHNTQITKIEIFGDASKTVTSVEVSGTPTKTSYEAGETFNPAGLTVTANYDDGSSKVVSSGITWTDGDGNELAALTEGTTSVTVKAVYKDIPSEEFIVYNLTVTAPKVLDHITVKTLPKVTYDAGDKFDPTNLVITKHFTDSSTEDVEYNSNTASAFTFNPSTSTSLTTSNMSVRVTYGGKYCDLPITVNPKAELKELKFTASNQAGANSGWSKSTGGYNNGYEKLVASTHYITSPSFTCSSIEKVVIKERTFGGPNNDQKKTTCEFVPSSGSSTTLGTASPSSTVLTNYTITPSSTVSGTGSIKISNKQASSSKGAGVSEITIYYYE